jgi:hypothetical protein
MKTKKFSREYLVDELGLPDYLNDGGAITLSDKIVGKTRWSDVHELIFRLPDQNDGTAWKVKYRYPATEAYSEEPWDCEKFIEATLVHQVEKETTNVWIKAVRGFYF